VTRREIRMDLQKRRILTHSQRCPYTYTSCTLNMWRSSSLSQTYRRQQNFIHHTRFLSASRSKDTFHAQTGVIHAPQNCHSRMPRHEPLNSFGVGATRDPDIHMHVWLAKFTPQLLLLMSNSVLPAGGHRRTPWPLPHSCCAGRSWGGWAADRLLFSQPLASIRGVPVQPGEDLTA